MPGWNTKRLATYGLVVGLSVLGVGSQVACHHGRGDGTLNVTQPPQLTYQTATILATAGEPFTSVAPDVSAYVITESVGTTVYTGFTFSVTPALPSGLTLDPDTGVISGTPAAGVTSPLTTYYLSAANSAGTATFPVSLGVQSASPASMTLASPAAVASVVGGSLVLGPPTVTVTGSTSTAGFGFGVSPALPAGLVLNPSTGLVSGKPSTALAGTAFTLTVTTPLGSANAPFTLLVAAAQPVAPLDFAYPADPSQPVVGQLFTGQTPTFTAGTDMVFTLASPSPALPGGLSLDPLTGVISGTPTAAAAQTTYVVTASNATGYLTANVTLTVTQ